MPQLSEGTPNVFQHDSVPPYIHTELTILEWVVTLAMFGQVEPTPWPQILSGHSLNSKLHVQKVI
jgi:hypothetical protein